MSIISEALKKAEAEKAQKATKETPSPEPLLSGNKPAPHNNKSRKNPAPAIAITVFVLINILSVIHYVMFPKYYENMINKISPVKIAIRGPLKFEILNPEAFVMPDDTSRVMIPPKKIPASMVPTIIPIKKESIPPVPASIKEEIIPMQQNAPVLPLLTGIMYVPGDPKAIIDGRIVSLNEKVKDFTVTEITKTKVMLRRGAETQELVLN
ncbi:MAG: hypothetical protein HQL28_00275 [Candidatus Omnitrophica bacterium]|nr:hypothetical protein [Candidatus Omnitrophota bacterium]